MRIITGLRRRSTLGFALLAAGVSLLLGACSGGGSPGGSRTAGTTGPGSGPTSTSGIAGATSTSTAVAEAPSCSLVPASQVNSALGVNVGAPTPAVNGPVTTCTYNGTPAQVIIRFQTGETSASFQAAKAGFAQNGEPTTDVSGLGDAAYSSTVGSGQFQTNTIVVLKGSIELLVTAPVMQEDVNALARQILLSI